MRQIVAAAVAAMMLHSGVPQNAAQAVMTFRPPAIVLPTSTTPHPIVGWSSHPAPPRFGW